MDNVFNRVLIFDGSYALHRSLSQPNNWELTNSKGIKTGGIYGVLRTVQKEIKKYNYFPVVIFDGGLSKRRLEIYPNYKRAQEKVLLENEQQKTEEQLIEEEFRREYNTSRNHLVNLLPTLGIPVIYADGWEGDDLIYILSKMCNNSIVVSDDKDLIQLVSEGKNKCRVWRPLREEFLDINSLKEEGLTVKDYIGCKSIVGDPSDNIPSACYQVGEKTALGLYKIYESVTNGVNKFPADEKELADICKKLDIPKRKAYLNFDENQFLTNLLLTDLSLLEKEYNENTILTLKNSIINQIKGANINLAKSILEEFEINSIDAESLFGKVNSLLDTMDITKNITEDILVEINKPKNSLFEQVKIQ